MGEPSKVGTKHPFHNKSNRDCPWAMGGDHCRCEPPVVVSSFSTPSGLLLSWEEMPNPDARKIFRSCDIPIVCPGCMKEITAGQIFINTPRGVCHEACTEKVGPDAATRAARRIMTGCWEYAAGERRNMAIEEIAAIIREEEGK